MTLAHSCVKRSNDSFLVTDKVPNWNPEIFSVAPSVVAKQYICSKCDGIGSFNFQFFKHIRRKLAQLKFPLLNCKEILNLNV